MRADDGECLRVFMNDPSVEVPVLAAEEENGD